MTSRWTTLDRIVSIEPGKRAVAVRNVPNTLAIFDTHFPRFAVLPGVLILGSLGELASELLRQQTGERWELRAAGRVGFRHFVRPGDQLELSVELKQQSEVEAILSGEAKVDGRLVTRARTLGIAPASS
ncbi:MAG: 3-hydroxyacyl-ACP dehydratase FabZ family protein [Solirubrobacteraceae bacterium]|jgi:3-hydroxyacyl-[acyl-carrier-protein] dehydratase